MKRKRKESCPSPILDEGPKRTKVQAQRKFAQNSGVHSPILTPIRDLETEELPHASVLPEPVELLPMKRPNTEDFLTFLCFRGTPILPQNLQFFNTASIVADGQVHEIKGDSPKNGPIDIAKCAGSSSEKPFIAFGVRKRADPIVISRQMERKRRHALAIQALRRKYQEQKMAKIRALTISKLSEKTTNKTLVKTNTIQKTETVTKKNNTLQKTKVIATKHVKVTTETLKTKVKPRMCLRSFRGKFVQKELPFRPRRPLPEKDTIRKIPADIKNMVRTSRNSNKIESVARPQKTIINRLTDPKHQPLRISNKPKVTTSSEPLGSAVVRTVVASTMKRPQIKRRILLPNTTTIVTTIVKPKLRSTTMKKSVISRRKAQQRLRSSFTKNNRPDKSSTDTVTTVTKELPSKPANEAKKKDISKKSPPEKVSANSKKPSAAEDNVKKIPSVEAQKPAQIVSRRLTRKDSGVTVNKTAEADKEVKKEITKNSEVKTEVKIAETGAKKMVKKSVNLKREFNLKTKTREVKKNVAVQKTCDTVSEKCEFGQKITRDYNKTVETTVKKMVTRKSEDVKQSEKASNKDGGAKGKKNNNPKSTGIKKESADADSAAETDIKKAFKNPKDDFSKKPIIENPRKILRTSSAKTSSSGDKVIKQVVAKEPSVPKDLQKPETSTKSSLKTEEKIPKEQPKKKPSSASKNAAKEEDPDEEASRRITRDSALKRIALVKSPKEDNPARKSKDHSKKESPTTKKVDQEFSKKIQELIDSALKQAEDESEENLALDEWKIDKKLNPSMVQEDSTDAKTLMKSPKKILKEDVENAAQEVNIQLIKVQQEETLNKSADVLVDSNALSQEPLMKGVVAKELPLKAKLLEETLVQKKHQSPAPEPLLPKKLTKEDILSKKPVKQDVPSKKPIIAKDIQETSPKKDDNPKRNRIIAKRDEPEHVVTPLVSSRPSRKTKEAAAIYMEILSHKLVNESTIDDDNVSIDSFPELPNVKKTEQREIELKAQAKTSKENPVVIQETLEDTQPKNPTKVEELCDGNPSPLELTNPEVPGNKSVEATAVCEIIKDQAEIDKQSSVLEDCGETKPSLGKRKSNPTAITSDDESDNEVLQAKIRKSEAQKSSQQEKVQLPKKSTADEDVEGTITRRQTRRCTQTIKETDSDSSDESFHIDVRVPKKKKITTRSRNRVAVVQPASVMEKNVDIILEAARVLEAEKPVTLEAVEDEKLVPHNVPLPSTVSLQEEPEQPKKTETTTVIHKNEESDSNESTTSDINLKSLQVKQRNKKLSKTKSSKSSAKSVATLIDSDEEPLAKLTNKSVGSINFTEEPKKKPEKLKTPAKKIIPDLTVTVMEPKPKRECTKRPSNYLPMLSSSDEDDEPYFLGFNTSNEDLNKPKVFVQSLVPSLDLLSKDIGRKEKVNMSNEQIEQWLKDSALAGSSVAKENDAMLKFGEKIPAEIPISKMEIIVPPHSPRVPDLKPCLEELKSNKAIEPQPCSSKAPLEEKPPKAEVKSPLSDRKWIFKKDKKELLPNKNAFSPENECSVYAFGEDNEDVVSTPFRRPSRRPSSTATSRSEDDLSKNDDSSKQGPFRKPNPSDSEDSRCFNIPQNPTKLSKTTKIDTMVPPSTYHHSKRPLTKPILDKFPEPFDDYKYKIPSSPSASSGSSAKLYKKGPQKPKGKASWESINPVYVSDFPRPTDPAKLVEAPVFHPTDQEFQDPLEYIERIRHKAEQFGICKIVPPSGFKPECKVSDDMRFTAYNQYVHKMLHRWGPNFKEFIAIRNYLATQSIFLKTPPLIGGMEIDLPRLYQTVQSLGGLKEVIEKKKWSKVSDHMKIPKSAQDRVTKLDDIYCKYLLPYDTLSPAEREKLFDEVETYWAKKESKILMSDPKQQNRADDSSEQDFYDSDDNDTEECTVKGKNMALNAFYRIARNTMSMYFKVSEPTALEVEQDFWRYVTQKQNHICVHSASIDCSTWGYGFPVSKNSPFARHAWNLKVLSNNNGSVLRSLGPVMGVTIPTLHVGMVFSACCWYRDPHGLPWVEYLHTGGNKIWYGIPSSSCEVFHAAMQKMVPNYCRDKELWLPSDTAMVPPGMLMDHNVSLCRTIQEPGQFIVVFPKVFTSSICTGYVVSESVYFATLHWLKTARNLFNDLKTSCEPSMFSLEKLLISISNDHRSSVEVLRVVLPFIEELCAIEKENRIRLRNFGKIEEEKVTTTEPPTKKKKIQSVDGDFECEVCRINLFVSMVFDTQDDLIYCLEDALKLVMKNGKLMERFKLRYSLDEAELDDMPKKINSTIETKLQKKVPGNKPTLLK